MAEKKASKRQVRTTESVREKSSKDVKKPGKKRVFSGAKASRSFKFLRFIVPPYFRNSWRELKQVSWPSKKQTWQLTLAVFIFALGFAVFITILDWGLDKVFKRILLK